MTLLSCLWLPGIAHLWYYGIWCHNRTMWYHNSSTRIISLGKYNSHTEHIFKSLKLLKLNDILKLQELKFYYKFENSIIIWNTIFHGYDTRINHNIHLLKPKHEYAKKRGRNNIPLLVNNTLNNILGKIHTQFARFYYIFETLLHRIT